MEEGLRLGNHDRLRLATLGACPESLNYKDRLGHLDYALKKRISHQVCNIGLRGFIQGPLSWQSGSGWSVSPW